jgi:predicted transcriptional regulator of viral defense system
MVNENFDPSENQRRVLNVLRDEYQANNRLIRDVTGLKRQRVQDALESLIDAGWIERPCRGLYRLVYDGEARVEHRIERIE